MKKPGALAAETIQLEHEAYNVRHQAKARGIQHLETTATLRFLDHCRFMSDEPSFNNSRLALSVGVVDNEDIGQEMQHAPKDSANLEVMRKVRRKIKVLWEVKQQWEERVVYGNFRKQTSSGVTSHCTVLVRLEQHHLAIWHCMEIVDSLVQGVGSPVMECKYHHLLD